MTRLTAAIDRRLVLRGLAALPLAAALPRALRAAAGAEAMLIALADLHSPYARLPGVLSAIDAARAAAPGVPAAVVINGDVFERGNAVALRSGGAPDWAFLAALAARGPVVWNLGNHETALVDDMAVTVARAQGLGIAVIGNIIDRRTGQFFAPVSARVGLGGMRAGFLGLAATNPFVYRAPVRDTLGLIDPVAFARDAFPAVAAAVDVPVLVSHAGVSPDKAILPGLKAGALALGAHDHLSFDHVTEAGVPYHHGGSWGGAITVIGLAHGAAPRVSTLAVAPGGGDEGIAESVAKAMAEHLTDEERAVIGVRDTALDLPASILLAAEAVRAAVEADIAFLGHTTFGAPLAAGPLTRYDFDAFIRFDGDIRVAAVPGDVLAQIMTRANQHRAASLDARTGDFVHAAEIAIDPSKTYRVATNGWTA
ncbi:MAG: 5'-nucleotidase C-terminal domain-containing protein, partial [Gemmobacter sp.]